MMTKDRLRQLTGDERLGQMRESEYLGAEDIDDGVEPVLTIAGLWYGSVTLQRGKENKDVLSFTEERVPGIMQVRPLIVNSTIERRCESCSATPRHPRWLASRSSFLWIIMSETRRMAV